ncbi:MAG: D-2-hydroxyacid dehydrogenase [Bacillota bacterium]|jgi:D-2-hydroxyacid dehydrogenase (NADP+)
MKILSARPWEDWEKELIAQVVEDAVFLEARAEPGQTLEDLVMEADVLYGFPRFPMDAIVRSPSLKLIHVASTGVDSLLTPEFRKSPIVLTNSRGVHADPVAEHALALMFAVAYGFRANHARQTARIWAETPSTRLYGKTAGLLGLGAIGQGIAKRCKGLDMRVIGLRRTTGDGGPYVDETMTLEGFPRLLALSDFVLCSLPLTQETLHLLTLREFTMMKPTAFLINVGRGAVIKEDDLVQALSFGIIAGAGLDVFEEEPLPSSSPLWGMENVVITPHAAGPASENRRKSFDILLENLGRLQRGEPLLNQVDKVLGY